VKRAEARYVFSAECGHPGRSVSEICGITGFSTVEGVRECCGQDGRAPLNTYKARAPLTLLLLSLCSIALADDFASLRADRAAIERVYYQHRLGEKPPFDQVLRPATLENLVRQDLRKEAALKQAYSVEVTPAMLDAEVQRINNTTRAPDMLAEIKTALANDPARFANVFAKPILVERRLREKFDNDDALHAPQRCAVEMVRGQLLTARSSRGDEALTEKSEIDQSLLTSAATNDLVEKLVAILKRSHCNAVTETTWQLGTRPAETSAPTTDEIEIKKRFGPNAQILSSPRAGGKDQKFYFEDLPEELQNVLRVQLRRPGDVSAVIEMPGGFLLYVAKEKTEAVLSVAGLSLPKRSYEQWLEEQNGDLK
jgi:hypothetical protein